MWFKPIFLHFFPFWSMALSVFLETFWRASLLWQSITRWRRGGRSYGWWQGVLGFNVGIPFCYLPKFLLKWVLFSYSSGLFVVVSYILITPQQCFVSICHLDFCKGKIVLLVQFGCNLLKHFFLDTFDFSLCYTTSINSFVNSGVHLNEATFKKKLVHVKCLKLQITGLLIS